MAQASGGTAGTSSAHGDGGMSSGASTGGGRGGGLGGSNGGSSGNSGNSSSRSSASSNAASSNAAAAAAANDNSKQSGSIMGGLKSSVESARSTKSTSGVSGSIQGAVNSAFGGKSPASSAMTTGYNSPGQVSNDVGAMNTQAAKDKAESQMGAFKTGYRNEANAGVTQSAFGATGGIGSLVGAAIGKTAMNNGFATDSDEANAAAAGGRLAGQNGLSNTTKGLGATLGGVLGGPIGSAIASMALGATSYAMQRDGMPSAFDGQQTQSYGNIAGGNGAFSNGGNGADTRSNSIAPSMAAAAQPSTFQAADDYSEQRKVNHLNLGSII